MLVRRRGVVPVDAGHRQSQHRQAQRRLLERGGAVGAALAPVAGDRHHGVGAERALHQAGQRAAGAELDEDLEAVGPHPPQPLHEVHRPQQLFDQGAPVRLRPLPVARARRTGVHGHLGRGEVHPRAGLGERARRVLDERGVEPVCV